MVSLMELQPGEKARICGFSKGDRGYRQKLLVMGLTPNTDIQVIRRAPLGDPIQIKVRATHLSLRQQEASLLQLERIHTS